ncbi:MULTISPECIES: hypothetical protein [Streptomyces]|uniref:hypothetical protein n=1 Tax=Streptomyces TaxID=1883 RepID=UPI00073E049D|nr:hypothetical protein [Streptomyces sp. FBKL.4005]MYU28690.1 hypothetical protein [Streptomyces sp. SID7810]CUW29731.1 hypothetical protein TUE45_04440 [Streptomyces reticuli]
MSRIRAVAGGVLLAAAALLLPAVVDQRAESRNVRAQDIGWGAVALAVTPESVEAQAAVTSSAASEGDIGWG